MSVTVTEGKRRGRGAGEGKRRGRGAGEGKRRGRGAGEGKRRERASGGPTSSSEGLCISVITTISVS